MDKGSIERWTDTTTFRVALLLAGVLVVPVLALGLLVAIGMLASVAMEEGADSAAAVLVALAGGGAVGMAGIVRASHGVRHAGRHNVTATLLCLAVGVAAALAVSALVAVPFAAQSLTPWGVSPGIAWPAALFVLANLVWALSGIGWMQRLTRRYAEQTGRAFDGIPAVLLFVAIALAAAAALIATAL